MTTARNSASNLQLRLAKQIIDLIAEEQLPVGAHFRESELTERFNVSRSPIRATLNYLASLGVVEQRLNKGFFLIQSSEDCGDVQLDFPQANDDICETIAKDWFDQKIAKEVSEAEIRKRYSLGRITASRILQKLSDDGLISRLPGYGWQFEPTLNTRKAHDESYDYRIIVESSAILLPTFHINPIHADNIKARHLEILNAKESNWDVSFLFDLDVEFHNFVAECSGNRFIVATIERQNNLRRLVEYVSLIDTGRLQESCLEHLEILQAIREKNRKRAVKLMREHLNKAKQMGPFVAS